MHFATTDVHTVKDVDNNDHNDNSISNINNEKWLQITKSKFRKIKIQF